VCLSPVYTVLYSLSGDLIGSVLFDYLTWLNHCNLNFFSSLSAASYLIPSSSCSSVVLSNVIAYMTASM
jgi:hypothetical protein